MGSSIGPGPEGGSSTAGQNGSVAKNQSQAQNQTQSMVHNETKNQSHIQNETMNQSKAQDMAGEGNGISAQVHNIIEQRKNGSIDVPQGLLVRIVARNRIINLGNETSLMLNETLRVNVMLEGKNRTMEIEPNDDSVNISEGGVSVETSETLDFLNDSLLVGGDRVLVMPSEVPQKIRNQTIKSMVLHVAEGDPVYSVNATKKAKVLWIFDADMDVEVSVDARTGMIRSEKRPWWSFLASTEE